MTDTLKMDVAVRDIVGKKVKLLRQQGLIPLTMYGKNFGPISAQVEWKTFYKTYEASGRTQPIEITITGKQTCTARVQDIQRHPVSRNILHADLYVINEQD